MPMSQEQYEAIQESYYREWWEYNGYAVTELANLLGQARDCYLKTKVDIPVAFLNAIDTALSMLPDPPEPKVRIPR